MKKIIRAAVLTSKESWFVSYAKKLVKLLIKKGYPAKYFSSHDKISGNYNIVFILSYFKIIPKDFLDRHDINAVVHESALPKGKGWSPLFWQVLENKKIIPIVLFEANQQMDAGSIYIKDFVKLNGTELYEEIRKIQAEKTIELCLRFIKNPLKYRKRQQKGISTYYKKRTPKDSELNIKKSIKEQFNLLRICSNKEFPAYFFLKGKRYILKIYLPEND